MDAPDEKPRPKSWTDPFEGQYVPFDRVRTGPGGTTFVASPAAPKPPGRIRLYLDVWCGGEKCDRWEHLESTKKRTAAAEARAKGWKFTRAHGWLCPDCAGTEAD
jgi:hypothetical protein